MFEKLRIIFSIPELRKKCLLTLGLLGVYRIGFHIPLPMVATNMAEGSAASDFFEKVSVFAASDLRQATIFGLGIMVAPVVGPNSARHGVGRIVDILMDPRTWILPLNANGGLTAGYALSVRERLLQPLDQLKTGSIDYYTAIKSVYWQNRLRTLRGEQSGEEFKLEDENLDSEFDSFE